MSDSPALQARDEQTTEPAIITSAWTEGYMMAMHLHTIDFELGYGNSTNTPTEERRNELLKERLNVLSRMMRRKS